MKKLIFIAFLSLLFKIAPAQLKQCIIETVKDTVKLPLYVGWNAETINGSFCQELKSCQQPNWVNYCDSMKRSFRINYTDTITFTRQYEKLKIVPVVDHKGKIVRIIITENDIIRFRNTYQGKDTLLYKETITALNNSHFNWEIPSNAKEGEFFRGCNVELQYPTYYRIANDKKYYSEYPINIRKKVERYIKSGDKTFPIK